MREIIFLLRDIQSDYFKSVKDIPWSRLDNLEKEYRLLLKKSRIKREYRLQAYTNSVHLLDEMRKRIVSKRMRFLHFIGSVSFVLLIPIIKFFISLVHKSKITNESFEVPVITNFDISLPITIYCWIAVYTIKDRILKTWATTFTLIATSLLLISSSIHFFFISIIVCAVIVFFLHTRDSWNRHMLQFELFAYYK